jgi:hypothetical protein
MLSGLWRSGAELLTVSPKCRAIRWRKGIFDRGDGGVPRVVGVVVVVVVVAGGGSGDEVSVGGGGLVETSETSDEASE